MKQNKPFLYKLTALGILLRVTQNWLIQQVTGKMWLCYREDNEPMFTKAHHLLVFKQDMANHALSLSKSGANELSVLMPLPNVNKNQGLCPKSTQPPYLPLCGQDLPSRTF